MAKGVSGSTIKSWFQYRCERKTRYIEVFYRLGVPRRMVPGWSWRRRLEGDAYRTEQARH